MINLKKKIFIVFTQQVKTLQNKLYN